MELSESKDLDDLARKHGLNVGTVRTWDKRGSVPDGKLAEFGARYGVAVTELTRSYAAESPPGYASFEPPIAGVGDSFSRRLATSIDVVELGLKAAGIDASKVPRSEMAAAVFRLLPWPIPKAPAAEEK